jgi:hypothetical protein
MKAPSAALAVALYSVSHVAFGCPCQGSSGPAAGVTTSTERLGASLTETTRFVGGAWRPNGEYGTLAPGEHQASEDITGIVGYRPIAPLEVSVEAAVGHQMFTSPEFDIKRTAFGDTTLRARWDALDEPMPYEETALPWPSVTVLLSLRIPTSPSGRGGVQENVFSGTTGSVGSSASSEGLGAWEPSLGAAFVRSFGDLFQTSAYFEAAYRFPDDYIGRYRHLGPRVFGQIGARYAPSPTTGIGLMTDLGWEGDVTYERTIPNSSQRLWTISAFGYLRAEPSRLRWGMLVRYAPPVDSIGKNASQSTSVGVSLGYVFL